MESGDTSDKDASPCDPKSNNLMQKEWSNAISMLVDMETEDSLKRSAIMVIAEKLALLSTISFKQMTIKHSLYT